VEGRTAEQGHILILRRCVSGALMLLLLLEDDFDVGIDFDG
jgi:hypothetical protein